MIKQRADYVQTLSTVCGCIVQMQDWVKDEEVTSCAICDQKFTLINRKHHCRRCGRIICKECLGKGMDEKLCLICSKLIELQNKDFDPQQLKDLLSNTKLLQVINKKDYLLYGELIRLFQNLVVTNEARNMLRTMWPQIFIKVFSLCRESLKIINSQSKNSFFQLNNQDSFDSQKAQITLQCCLGLIQNYTGTGNQQYAEDLLQYDPMGLMIDLLNAQLDLSKQEICVQIMRNLCRNKDLTQVLLDYQDFKELIQRLFDTKVDNIRLALIQVLTIIQLYQKEKLLMKFSKNKQDALKFLINFYLEVKKQSKTSQTAAKTTLFCYLLLAAYSDNDDLRQILIDENIYTDLAQTLQLQAGIAQDFASYCVLQALKDNQDDDDFCITLLNMVMTKTAVCNLIEGCRYPTIKEFLYYSTKYYKEDIKALKSKQVYQKAKDQFSDSDDEQKRKILKYIQKLRN